MNFYKHHIGDWDQATAHLTFTEGEAFSRLVRKYYAEESPLPVEVKEVCRLARAKSKLEISAVTTILNEFFTLKRDGWHNRRCDKDIKKYQNQAVINAETAQERERKKRARKDHESLHDSSTSARKSREPNHKPEPTHPEPINQNPIPTQSPPLIFEKKSGHGRAGALPPLAEVWGQFDDIDPEVLRAMPGVAAQRVCVFVGINARTAARAVTRKDLTADFFMRNYEAVLLDDSLGDKLAVLVNRLGLDSGKNGRGR